MGNKSRYTANLVSDNNLFVDITNDRVGVGSTHPTAKLDVDGTLNVSGVSTFQSDIHFDDNDKINMGDNDDLQIYHHNNGTGVIQNAGSGQLQLRSNTIRLLNQATDEDFAFFRDDGAVELYYDDTKKFETTGYGATVFGGLNVSGISTFTGNVSFGSSAFFGDGDTINMGDSDDLKIFHSGITGNIKNTTGTLILQSGTVRIQDGGSSQTAFSAADGVAKLYFENSEKLTTNAQGIDVTGHTETDTLNVSGISTFNDNLELIEANIVFGLSGGASDDRLKFHNSEIYQDNHSFRIVGGGVGISLRADGTNTWSNSAGDEDYITAIQNAEVQLYYDNSKKFETLGAGVTVTGTTFSNQLSVSGVSTFSNNVTMDGGDITFTSQGDKLIFTADASNPGSGGAIEISTSGSGTAEISGNSNELRIYNQQDANHSIAMRAGAYDFKDESADYYALFYQGSVRLYHPSSAGGITDQKLETTSGGINVIGHTETDTLNVSGICTAASFSGNGNDIVHSTWTLGANGSSHYTFTGPGGLSNTDDPKIYLARGQTYEFVNNSGGSHPFQIQQSNGSAYSTGVTNNGASSGTIRFEVPFSAPNTLQYKCTNHSSMGNTIIVYPDISP